MAKEVQLEGVSLGFVAISVDDDENRARAAELGPARWPHLLQSMRGRNFLPVGGYCCAGRRVTSVPHATRQRVTRWLRFSSFSTTTTS